MWYESVPEMQGEVEVVAAQAVDEVILVSLACKFCGVGVMKVWGNELKIDTEIAQKRFESAGSFIVQHLVLGGEAVAREIGVEDTHESYEVAFVAIGEWLR